MDYSYQTNVQKAQEDIDEEQREVRGGMCLVAGLVLLCCVLFGFGLGVIGTALVQHFMGG